jgi:flagellar export protein FliJ
MKKFVFSFEKLLNLKRLKENAKKRELANLNAEINKLTKEINNLQQKLIKTKTFYMQKQHLKVQELLELSQFEINTDNAIKHREIKIEKLQNKVNTVKLELLNHMKERKVLESLKEKKKAAYLTELTRKINSEATELFLLRRKRV